MLLCSEGRVEAPLLAHGIFCSIKADKGQCRWEIREQLWFFAYILQTVFSNAREFLETMGVHETMCPSLGSRVHCHGPTFLLQQRKVHGLATQTMITGLAKETQTCPEPICCPWTYWAQGREAQKHRGYVPCFLKTIAFHSITSNYHIKTLLNDVYIYF